MWERVLTEDVLLKMINMLDDETEDLESMNKFVEHLSAHVEYAEAIGMALKWKNYSEFNQLDIAISEVGEEDASRFMLLMDYMSDELEYKE